MSWFERKFEAIGRTRLQDEQAGQIEATGDDAPHIRAEDAISAGKRETAIRSGIGATVAVVAGLLVSSFFNGQEQTNASNYPSMPPEALPTATNTPRP